MGNVKKVQTTKRRKDTKHTVPKKIHVYDFVEKSHFIRFFFIVCLFATNKLHLSLYTHTASGNPSFAWFSLSVLKHFFLFPDKRSF